MKDCFQVLGRKAGTAVLNAEACTQESKSEEKRQLGKRHTREDKENLM
jgi:hypothetical protein